VKRASMLVVAVGLRPAFGAGIAWAGGSSFGGDARAQAILFGAGVAALALRRNGRRGEVRLGQIVPVFPVAATR